MFSKNDKKSFMEDSQTFFVTGFLNILESTNAQRKKDGKKKITQTQLAEKIGVSSSNLSGFLNFHRNYSEEKRKELARAIKVDYLTILNLGKKIENHDRAVSSYYEFTTANFIDSINKALGGPDEIKNPSVDEDAVNECPTCGLSHAPPHEPSTTVTPTESPKPQSLQEEYDKKHAIIVKGFRNKERGIDINKDLVELEGLDEDELDEIHALIKAKLNKLRKRVDVGNDPKKTGTLDE